MPNETYPQAVIRGAAALKRGEEANWTLARLTYEHTLSNGRVASQIDRVSMEDWCRDIREESGRRFSTSTGRRYRAIWERYGLDASSPAEKQTTFHDAYAEVEGTPNRERMMEYEGTRLLERGTKAQKVEQAAALLRDPDVREAATDIGTPLGGTLLGVSLAQKAQHREAVKAAEERSTERFKNDPTDLALRNARAITDLTGILSDFARDVAKVLPTITTLPEQDRDAMSARLFLREAHARAMGATEQVGALLATGKVGGDVDDFVQSILGGSGGGAKG